MQKKLEILGNYGALNTAPNQAGRIMAAMEDYVFYKFTELSNCKIKRISIITAQGASTHEVGRDNVDSIKKMPLTIDGDPIQHYCGFDSENNMLFSISAIAPCEIFYFVGEEKV